MDPELGMYFPWRRSRRVKEIEVCGVCMQCAGPTPFLEVEVGSEGFLEIRVHLKRVGA